MRGSSAPPGRCSTGSTDPTIIDRKPTAAPHASPTQTRAYRSGQQRFEGALTKRLQLFDVGVRAEPEIGVGLSVGGWTDDAPHGIFGGSPAYGRGDHQPA